MFAVVVTFDIKAAEMPSFLSLMHKNAATSLEKESGCHQFDVCVDPSRETEVFLYELYTDKAAFDVHLASEHFRTFDAAVAHMIAHKDVKTFSRVTQ